MGHADMRNSKAKTDITPHYFNGAILQLTSQEVQQKPDSHTELKGLQKLNSFCNSKWFCQEWENSRVALKKCSKIPKKKMTKDEKISSFFYHLWLHCGLLVAYKSPAHQSGKWPVTSQAHQEKIASFKWKFHGLSLWRDTTFECELCIIFRSVIDIALRLQKTHWIEIHFLPQELFSFMFSFLPFL